MSKKEHYAEAEKYRQLAEDSAKEKDNIGKVYYSSKAGEEFEKAGNYKRAQGEYGYALNVLDSMGKSSPGYGQVSKLYWDAHKRRMINIEKYLKKYLKRREDRKHGGLEKATAVASIMGVLGGIFFLSTNVTGNAIANVSQSSGNILGAVLLVVGLVAGFFWVKKK